MLILSSNLRMDSMPIPFVERYRTADGPAIKVAIFLLLGNSSDVTHIAEELSLPITTVERSLQFWFRAGLLVEETIPVPETIEPEKKKPLISERVLGEDEINRLLRNPEISLLLNETQNHLGRVLTSNESTKLMSIYQFEELPVDVILMIVAFSEPRTKRNLIPYVEKVARTWKEDDITTMEKAEKHIALIEKREKRYSEVGEILEMKDSSFTFREREYINAWYEEYGYDIPFIEEAFSRAYVKTVSGLNRLLRSWSSKGYKTIRETRMEASNTPAPVPQRRKAGKKDDLFERAMRETKAIRNKNKPRVPLH